MRFSWVLVIVSLLFFSSKDSHASDKLNIFVSILPEKYFVEKIGKDLVNVSVLVPPGASPHSYEPRPSQMSGISRARLFFTIGIEFEKAWVPRIQNSAKNLQIIPLDSGITKITMTDHHDEDHKKGSGHEGLDPHIWLSPELVKVMAKTIANHLSAADPAHKETYFANYKEFINEILDLQAKIRTTFADCTHPIPFMVFHPAWAYFAKEFDLQEIAIEIQGKEPSPKELGEVLTLAKSKQIKTIFIQPQFSSRSAEQIAHEIGGHTAIANDLAPNWEENLLQVAQMIGKCK